MSWVTEIKAKNEAVEKRMLLFLDADQAWLGLLKVEYGQKWLALQYGSGNMGERLRDNVGFWAWWINAWAGRDARLSKRLQVKNTGVMTHQRTTTGTDFIHDQAEFRVFYQGIHKVEDLTIQLDKDFLADIIKAGRKAQ